METAAVIAIAAIILILAVIVSIYIIRYAYARRFRAWQETEMQKWEGTIAQERRDAVSQSRAVLGGKFTEQMVPYFPDFKYDPTEVRFIGSPIDMVVFPGLSRGDPEEVVILEIKTGKSAGLTPAQKKIRQLIEDGMVRWDEIYRSNGEEEDA
jgi:predicted Holliday junction resolvase-like endonuclease